MRKYLKTIKDVEALRNTDTKIYCTYSSTSYLRFVNGILCGFYEGGKLFSYNLSFSIDPDTANYYIEVEDEPSEDLIGKLGWFWDDDEDDEEDKYIGVLSGVFSCQTYSYLMRGGDDFKHFRPLTPEEVEKYTGYKVVKED
jgi:hypothetical protein